MTLLTDQSARIPDSLIAGDKPARALISDRLRRNVDACRRTMLSPQGIVLPTFIVNNGTQSLFPDQWTTLATGGLYDLTVYAADKYVGPLGLRFVYPVTLTTVISIAGDVDVDFRLLAGGSTSNVVTVLETGGTGTTTLDFVLDLTVAPADVTANTLLEIAVQAFIRDSTTTSTFWQTDVDIDTDTDQPLLVEAA